MRSFPWQAIALLVCLVFALARCAPSASAAGQAWWEEESDIYVLEGERARHLRFVEAYLSRVKSFSNVRGEIVVQLLIQPDGEVMSATVGRSNVRAGLSDFQDELLLGLVFRDFPPASQSSIQKICLEVHFEDGGAHLREIPSDGLVSLSSLEAAYPALYQ